MKILAFLLLLVLAVSIVACNPVGKIESRALDGAVFDDAGKVVGTFKRDAKGHVTERKGVTDGIKDDASPATGPRKVTGKEQAQTDLRGAAKTIGVIAGLLCLASVVGVVASFWVPWLPRRTALQGFAVSLGLMVVQYWVNRYGEGFAVASFWVSLAAGIAALVAFGWPWARTLYNKNKQDAAIGHLAAGNLVKASELLTIARPDDKPGEIAAFIQRATLSKT